MDGVDFGVADLRAPFAHRVQESLLHYLYLVRSGACWFERADGGTPFRVSPGDVVCVTQNVAHVIRDALSTPEPRDIRPLPLRPLRAPLGPPPDGLGHSRIVVGWVPLNVDPLVRFLPTVILLPKDEPVAERVRHYAADVEAELAERAPDSGTTSIVRRLSEVIVIELVRFVSTVLHDERRVWSRGLADPEIARAIAAVLEDPGRPWTLVTLARLAGLSRAAFEARFRRFADESPKRYVVKVRMRRAAAEIERGTRSIAAIADSLGYASVASFHRAFKREVGVTPAEWRRSKVSASPPGSPDAARRGP